MDLEQWGRRYLEDFEVSALQFSEDGGHFGLW